LKKLLTWKIDIGLTIVVIVGFEMIEQSIEQLEQVPLYYDFMTAAKWLLIAGFTLHGIINWFIEKKRK